MNANRFLAAWQSKAITLTAFALASGAHAQTIYTWVSAAKNGAEWTTVSDWSPSGTPGVLDTLTNGTDTVAVEIPQSGEAVSIITPSSNWLFYSFGTTTGSVPLTVGTVNQTVTAGTLTFRNNSTAEDLDFTVGTINVSNTGTVDLGGNNGSLQEGLEELNQAALPGGTTPGMVTINGSTVPVAVNLNGGSLNLNVLSDYSLGVVDATGTGTNTIVLIENSDTITVPYPRNAYVNGLEGSAALTVYGASGTEGGTATLNLTESGATNYASAAVLADKSGTPSQGVLTLAVNLSGGATQTLTGASTYSGGTTVSGGTLYVSNTTTTGGSGLGTGSVTVASGATLAGTGTIAPTNPGSVTNSVTINGVLMPGDLGQTASNPSFTPGVLTFNLTGGSQLILGSGSALDLTLGSSSSAIDFTTAGAWLSSTGAWTLNLSNGGGSVVGTAYPVFSNATATTPGFAPGTVTYTSGVNFYTLATTAYEFQTSGSNYTITLPGAVITSSPPASTNLVVGGTASFTVAASGTGTLSYQWFFGSTALANGGTISGVTTATLNLSNLQLSEAGQYTCAITDGVGTVTSPAAALVAGPTIGTEPVATSANAGGNASFSVSASGGTLTYQWYLNGTALSNGTQTDGTVVSGATAASLTLTGVHGADAGSYTVVVTDTGGPTTSSAATLTVNEPPAFTVQPVSVGLAAGQTASFYAPATGAGTVTYQWYLSSTAITNATDAYLLVTPVSSANAGSYTCIATNAAGSTTSTAATLTLSASTDLGRLTNVSVRTNCGTGSANIIAGFVLGGAGNTGSSKSMLIRADGPELANFGVPGFLPDPSLDVFNTTDSPAESVGQNTGWCVPTSNEAPVVAAENAVYAFALTTNSASSAIVLDLPPDQYTENVTGLSGDTGIALAEIYDVTNATETYSAALPRLINVSARANVAASGAGNLIAGFTIGGSTDKTVLVRGTGPGLAEFSLTGLLAQPTLAVYSTESIATLVATNTGWDFDPVLASTAAGLYAFGQTSSADCCLLVTLPPGTYTANLDSNNGASGLALVEVYEVP